MDGTTDSINFKTTGGGEIFLKFIKDEVMPFVLSLIVQSEIIYIFNLELNL